MRNLVLVLPVLVLFGGINSVVAQVASPSLPPILSSAPPSAAPGNTSTPEPTSAPATTAHPSPTPTGTQTTSTPPSPTTSPIVSPSAATTEPTEHAGSSSSPTSAPGIGGVTTSSTPTPRPSVTPAPPKVVSSVIKNLDTSTKPVIKDIGDNAMNTLLETPLSVFIPQNPKNVYHNHGLSKSSTDLLLSGSFLLSLCGFSLLYSRFIFTGLGRLGARVRLLRARLFSGIKSSTPPTTAKRPTTKKRVRTVEEV